MAVEVKNRELRALAKVSRAAAWSGLLGMCLAGAPGCRDKAAPNPAPPTSSAQAVPSESAPRRRADPPIVTLEPELFAPDNTKPSAVYAIEGALMVVEDVRVGRVAGKSIEWIGSVPKKGDFGAENYIISVEGRWPDSVGAETLNSTGRAPMPTLFPLTWKSRGYMVGPGGQGAYILGLMRIDDAFLLVAWSIEQGHQIIQVNGPKLKRKFTPRVMAKCATRELQFMTARFTPAVSPDALGTTPAGTMLSVGHVCEADGPVAAEVWDKGQETSHRIDLKPYWLKGDSARQFLKGEGDTAYFPKGTWSQILRYSEGKFDLLPSFGRPMLRAFTSQSGKLYATDDRTISQFDGERWVPVARLASKGADAGVPQLRQLRSIVSDGETFWATAGDKVYRLVPAATPDGAAPPETALLAAPESPATCTTPFVYLFSVGYTIPRKYDYPKTRKALQSFAEAGSLKLVEFDDTGSRQVGVKVTSMAQGEALIAHLKPIMTDDDPRLTCFEPVSVQEIPIAGAKK
jgi:hypothetical protein